MEEATYLARQILKGGSDPDYDQRLIQMATDFSNENFGGKQLPVIQEAKNKGFAK